MKYIIALLFLTQMAFAQNYEGERQMQIRKSEEKYLNDNIHYPDVNLQNNIKGIVYAKLSVDASGTIQSITTRNDGTPEMETEVKRVISSYGKWGSDSVLYIKASFWIGGRSTPNVSISVDLIAPFVVSNKSENEANATAMGKNSVVFIGMDVDYVKERLRRVASQYNAYEYAKDEVFTPTSLRSKYRRYIYLGSVTPKGDQDVAFIANYAIKPNNDGKFDVVSCTMTGDFDILLKMFIFNWPTSLRREGVKPGEVTWCQFLNDRVGFKASQDLKTATITITKMQ